MSIARTVIARPISVVIICTTIVMLSMAVLPFMPQEFLPKMEYPYLSIATYYRGASPLEIESTVTKVLETQLGSVEGLKNISSTSQSGYSSINLEFEWGIDLDQTANDVRDKIESIRRSLPDQSDPPIVHKFSLGGSYPISSWVISSENNLSPDEIYTIADKEIKPYLERIKGVSGISLTGGQKERVNVELSQNRLEAYNVSASQVQHVLQSENIELGAGNIEFQDQKIPIRLGGKFETLSQIENLIIKTIPVQDNKAFVSIRIRDLGTVSFEHSTKETVTLFNGRKSLDMSTYKRSGSNIAQVDKAITKKIRELEKKLPEKLQFTKVFDTAAIVKTSLNEVLSSIVNGFILTIIILIIFLRSAKSAMIIAITMPLSVLTTLIMMYFFGLSLNVISLAGLNLGIGMIVDSSIVLLENTTRYREKGVMARSSAILGCEEMTGSIISGSLTTICVFLPLVLFKKDLGQIGILFEDMAFTIVISLATSLIFALITVPVFGGVLLPITTKTQKPLNKIMQKIDPKISFTLDYLDLKYAKSIEWALSHRRLIFSSIFLSLIISAVLYLKFVGFQFMPTYEDNSIYINYSLPPGTSLESNISIMKDTMGEIQQTAGKGLEYTKINLGSTGYEQQDDAGGSIQLIAPKKLKKRTLTSTQIMSLARKVLSKIPGIQFSLQDRGPTGGQGGPSVVLRFSSENQKLLEKTAEEVMNILKNVKVLTEVQTNLTKTKPEISVKVNHNKAREYGLSLTNIAAELRNNFHGGLVGTMEYNEKNLDIWVGLQKKDRQEIFDLEKISFTNNQGAKIPLASIAQLEHEYSQPVIVRNNQRKELSVFAYSATDKNGQYIAASTANAAALKALHEQYVLPGGVSMATSGGQQELFNLLPKVALVLGLAIFLVYAVMASQFENLKDPFIIVMSTLTIPIGPSIFYVLTNSVLSIYSIVGFIILSGIVVNHGIVLVDYTSLLRKRRIPLYDAVILAGRHRLRPIVMTTLTTILGMLPMAIAKGEGTGMSGPIGQTVVTGMISSSILTLLFTPVLYYSMNIKSEKKRIENESKKRVELETAIENVQKRYT